MSNKKHARLSVKKSKKVKLSEKELITKRESNEITPEEFIRNLKGDLKVYWSIIHRVLRRQRTIRNIELLPFAKQLGAIGGKRVEKLNTIRGILAKFVEWEVLTKFKPATYSVYLCNLSDFYQPEELSKIISDKETNLITKRLNGKPVPFKTLAKEFEKIIGCNLLATLLSFYIDKGVLEETKSGFRISTIGQEFGSDPTSIQTLDTIALENQLALKKKEEAAKFRFATLSDISDAQKKDLENKEVPVIEFPHKKVLRISTLGEILYGNQFSDNAFVEAWLKLQKESGFKPDVTLVTGLVQGTFLGYRVDKVRTLTVERFLNEIGPQYSAADLLLKQLEGITQGRVFYQQGDDDWDLAKNYALIARAAEKGVAQHGVSNLSPEATRYLINIHFYRKLFIQWEIIQRYMYLIGRSLKNVQEVSEETEGEVEKNEYRLIVEILKAQEAKLPYPEEYKKVVNVNALNTAQIGKRHVTPDPLILKIGGFTIQSVHNTSFSDITQYMDSLMIPEMNIRARQVLGETTPNIFIDFHQERFYLARVSDSLVMNLPGCQNTTLANRWKSKTFFSKVLSSKAHRQLTFRKEPITPGITNFEVHEDGRIKMTILNRKILEVIEAAKGSKEVVDTVSYVSDLQFGSITARPEFAIRYMDYSLYERQANHMINNGDLLHTFVYPNHGPENRPDRLISVDSQERFLVSVMAPIIVDAPALRKWIGQMGNHEWNVWSGGLTGQNNLKCIELYLKGYFEALQKRGLLDRSIDVSLVSRIRFMNSGNPTGDHLNHPYSTICVPSGYKIGVQHMWQAGGGRTPVEQMIRWVKKMAHGAADLHVLFGGHWHSLWMSMVYNILMVQVPASAGISGFELQRGLISQVMFVLAEFSNKRGITIEIIPWQFLANYKCQSPFYKGKDKELELPKPGSIEYKHGRHSALIEQMIDDITQYVEV